MPEGGVLLQSFVFRMRLLFLALCMATALLFCVAQLYRLQALPNASYIAENEKRFYSTEAVKASRGEILDRYGRKLVTKVTTNYVDLDSSVLTRNYKVTNERLLTLVQLCDDTKTVYTDTFPVTVSAPFSYDDAMTDTQRRRLDRYLEKKGWTELTAPELIDAMRLTYSLDEALDDRQTRKLLGIRYELDLRVLFSNIPAYRFASDIDMRLVTAIQEHAMKGIRAAQEATRSYSTNYAAHILGRVEIGRASCRERV